MLGTRLRGVARCTQRRRYKVHYLQRKQITSGIHRADIARVETRCVMLVRLYVCAYISGVCVVVIAQPGSRGEERSEASNQGTNEHEVQLHHGNNRADLSPPYLIVDNQEQTNGNNPTGFRGR